MGVVRAPKKFSQVGRARTTRFGPVRPRVGSLVRQETRAVDGPVVERAVERQDARRIIVFDSGVGVALGCDQGRAPREHPQFAADDCPQIVVHCI